MLTPAKYIFLISARGIIPFLPHMMKRQLAFITGTIEAYGHKFPVIDKKLTAVLGHALTAKKRRKIILEGFRNFHLDLYEIWSFPHINLKKINQLCRFRGLNHLECALKQKRGALVLVTHFGSWKILIAALSHYGYSVTQVGINPLDSISEKTSMLNNKIMEMEYHCEQALPALFVYAGGYMRDIFRTLEHNGIVIMSVDAPRKKSRKVRPFLKDRLYYDPSPLKFAAKQNIPVIPLFPVREKSGRHTIYLHPNINPQKIKSSTAAQAFMEHLFFDLLSSYVKKFPSHYIRSLYASEKLPHPLDRKHKEVSA